jgi:hypothetical protein
MIVQSYHCNQCGKAKLEANHWILAEIAKRREGVVVYFLPWEEDTARRAEIAHLCGHGCAAKYLQRWMSEHAQLQPERKKSNA